MRNNTTDRILIIDELRGLAALAVAWFHFTNGNQNFLSNGLLKMSGTYGWVGVEVFFVISGFIIPYTLSNRQYSIRKHFWTFLGKRLVRLDPPYLAGILLVVALWYLSAALPSYRGVEPEITLRQVLMHLAYANAIIGEAWLNPVFWSLAIEFQYYLLIGLVFPIINHASRYVRMLALAILCCLPFFATNEGWVLLWCSLFVMGIAAWQLRSGMINVVVYGMIVSLAALVTVVTIGWFVALVGVAAGLLIAFVDRLRIPGLLWMGTISYSLYLIHVPIGGRIVNMGERLQGSEFAKIAVLVGATTISIAVAWLFYVCIERTAHGLSARIRYER